MDQKQEFLVIKEIVEKNRRVPFIRAIMDKKFHSTLVSERYDGDKTIVWPGDVNKVSAIKSNNFIEFDTAAQADFFVSFFLQYNRAFPLDEISEEKPKLEKEYIITVDGKKEHVTVVEK